jgi:hypothetical protein
MFEEVASLSLFTGVISLYIDLFLSFTKMYLFIQINYIFFFFYLECPLQKLDISQNKFGMLGVEQGEVYNIM